MVQTSATPSAFERKARLEVLTLSTLGFTLMFAVWLMFGVLGIPIRKEFGLTDVQLSWLSAVAILNGSLWRLLAGILADRYGGRGVFTVMLLFTAIPAYLVSQATSYPALLLYAFLVGFAGNAFSVGIAWNAAWFPREQQGFALGVFGAGNVGASVTKFIGPALIASVPAAGYLGGLMPGGWRFVPFLYAVLLVLMALAMWLFTPRADRKPGQGRPFLEMLRPLRNIRVWRFSLYYVVVFGAYVALSAWLPKYYVDVFGLPLYQAALLTALFIFPASLLRPVGGYFSDRYGARRVMYWTFGLMLLASGVLMMPEGHIVLELASGNREVLPWHMSLWLFTALVFLIGTGMGVGKAAVYKHIPEYFPKDVGAVGGLVGMLGALGGFFLPPLFAYAQSWTGLPQTTFLVLFLLTLVAAIWMHLTVLSLLNRAAPHLEHSFEHSPEGGR
ncbi:MFS transporter [Meiothermus granaticius]|uniref:Putative nitrate transporter NarT n=1 Tax=Meiothermus granaticius NBRC 107808 TaxID=1227551 RepID=A0A399FF17_9DEIN|nr:nitrate/nitrite transporter [Meiothermus granaticius]RIH93802.1 putative nitrate transporter NarT [Meiothermus granaticius NBRC 107808]GEM85674.1 nitrite extrusion protein [Meiothermus granaticius NBRC 107808]